MEYPLRKFARHPLRVPVIFSWTDRQGLHQQAEGYTRDISPAGMFLFAPTCPPPGTPVGLDAVLPPFCDNGPSWQMKAQGHVVRVEPAGEGREIPGFAAVNDQLALHVRESNA